MAYTTINKSTDYFNTKLYTGNASTQSITGVGFQPDWTWIKNRDSTPNHVTYDIIRGATKRMEPNTTDAEDTKSNGLTSFDTDGFSVGSALENNGNGNGIVAWNWLADNTSGSANTDGSISSTVSANTTSGFSIVKFTGTGANATVGHGLGVKPAMIIQKNLSISSAWSVWHKSFSGSQVIYLNETGAVGTNTSSWNSTEPTSSVFSVGTGSYPNGSGNEQIYYVFAEKQGYSKFGSYTGNGNADGPFVYTGFKPAMVIAKRTDSTGNWRIRDNRRPAYNVIDKVLRPNTSEAEITEDNHDFLSNGFKVRTTGPENNASGGTFIYMAFAEAPLVGTNGVTAKAR